MQIVSAVSMAQGIPHLSVDCLSNGKEVCSQFYKAMVQPHVAHQSSGTVIDESGIFSLGSVKIYALTDTEFIALYNYLPNAPVSNLVKQFLCCQLNGKIFQSEKYCCNFTKNSHTVIIEHGTKQIVQILFYFQYKGRCSCLNRADCSCDVENLAMI